MKSGELRRWSPSSWSSSSNGDPDIPFLVMSIDGDVATFMDGGEVYFIRASTIEELSEPTEEPNDQG